MKKCFSFILATVTFLVFFYSATFMMTPMHPLLSALVTF